MSMIQTRNQSALGTTFLDARYLMLDCTNDPLTAGLEINAATLTEPVLILQTTDDNAANPLLDCQNAAGATLSEIQSRGGLSFAAAVGQATPGLVGLAGARFFHTYGTHNLFVGVNAGNFTLTNVENIGIGELALGGLTSGAYNVGLGYWALRVNTSGWGNMAIGTGALMANLAGFQNVAIGVLSLASNISGDENMAIGAAALRFNTIGNGNVAIGKEALTLNQSGIGNMAIGTYAIATGVTTEDNIGIGTGALLRTIADANIAIGTYAGRETTTGASNVSIGHHSGWYNQTGSNSTLIGFQAGKGVALHNKSGDIFIGYQAGFNETGSNKLYIANSNTATPLVYGEFDTWRLAFGNQYAVDKYGQLTHASGQFAAVGDAQDSRFVCRLAQASHAVNTWYALYPDGGTTPERLTIAAETGWTVIAHIIGITQGAAQQWGYEIIGLLERDGAGNTTLAGQTLRTIFESDAAYEAQLAADDANEALEVQVRRTGGVDYNVRWTASAKLVEVTYPS